VRPEHRGVGPDGSVRLFVREAVGLDWIMTH
jgi:hypothetical protein